MDDLHFLFYLCIFSLWGGRDVGEPVSGWDREVVCMYVLNARHNISYRGVGFKLCYVCFTVNMENE